jgi:uncharacterized membrane protein (GlpM family)
MSVFSWLLLYKFCLSAGVVVLLSFVAEKISPRWAGVLSGFPTGTAITLYFYGLENGLEFAGRSAIYNMVGLVAMQMCIYCYFLAGKAYTKLSLATAVCGAILGYGVTATILSKLSVTLFMAIVIPIASFFFFWKLFQPIGTRTIQDSIKTGWGVIVARAVFAALIISVITGISRLVGEPWAGLFSAFPTTLFPLLLIIHYSYGGEYAYAIIKHVPEGLGGLLVYSLIIYIVYPHINLYGGILLAFGGALIYLLLYQLITQRLAVKNG